MKFWLKIKEGDRRNKIQQGIFESRKTAKANNPNVVGVYLCGEIQGILYSVMEFVDGVSVRNWLQEDNPSLARRIFLAKQIIDINNELHYHNIVHGDLHLDNIIIIDEFREARRILDWPKREKLIDDLDNFKIIDFGTSYFASEEYSWKRHIRILINTINEICHPLQIQSAYGNSPLEDDDFLFNWEEIYRWFINYLLSIRCGLLKLGIEDVGFDFEGVDIYEDGECIGEYSISEVIEHWLNEFDVNNLEGHLVEVLEKGGLKLDYYSLGYTKHWDRLHPYNIV